MKVPRINNPLETIKGDRTDTGVPQEWRASVLEGVLRAMFIFATPVFLLGVVNIIQDLQQGFSSLQAIGLFSIYLTAYTLMFFTSFGKRWGYTLRATILISLLLLVGIANLYLGGLSGDGLLFLFAAVALSAVLFEFRRILIINGLALLSIIFMAVMLTTGRLVIPWKLQVNSANVASWSVRVMVFLLLSVSLTASTTYLVRSLENSLKKARHHAKQLAALYETALDITTHRAMPELLEAVVERATQLLNASGGGIYIVDPDGETLQLTAAHGLTRYHLEPLLKKGEDPISQVFQTGQHYLASDCPQAMHPMNGAPDSGHWHNCIQVPIQIADASIGVLGCYNDHLQHQAFSAEDIQLLKNLAHQAAIAIENANLFKSTQQAETHLDALIQAAPSAIVSIDENYRITTFNRTAEEVFLCPATEAIGQPLDILIPEALHHAHRQHLDNLTRTTRTPYSAALHRELSARRRNGEIFPIEASISKIEVEGQIILTAILRDITLRKQALEALRESEARTRALLELSKEIEVTSTYDEVICAARKIIKEILGYQNAWFYIIDDAGETSVLLGACGPKAAMISTLLPILPLKGDAYLEEITRGEGPAVVVDARSDPRTDKEIVALMGNRTIINIPVYFVDHHMGTFGIGSFDDEGIRPATPEQMHFLSAMTGHIAVAIDRITQTNERKRAEEEIAFSYQSQQTINTLLRAAFDPSTLEEKLDRALAIILATPRLPHPTKIALFLTNVDSGELLLANHRNLDAEIQRTCARLLPGKCVCGKVIQDKRSLFTHSTDPKHEIHCSSGIEQHCHYNIPILSGNLLLGVLVVYLPFEHIQDEQEINFLETVASTLAGLIERTRTLEQIERTNQELTLAYDTTLEGWSRALDLRDKDTEGHTRRVTKMTMKLARRLGIPDSEMINIQRGALLHDIGKMGVPDEILHKPGPLNKSEWEIMRRHPTNAYQMLSPIQFLRQALDIPYLHHERWDGNGYPNGLVGEQIPLAARIFAVVDVWDALSSDRPYRRAWPRKRVLEYIRENAGTHFDPQIVEKFMTLIGE